MRTLPTLVLIFVLLAGCARNRVVYVSHSLERYPAKSASAPVLLTYSEKLDRSYEELGTVFAYARSAIQYDRVAELLKGKARQMGADAVIKVQYKQRQVFSVNPFFISVPYNAATGEGIAVRYVSPQNQKGGDIS